VINELAALVRQHDYERYICTLFAPAKARPHLWMLQTIAYELLRVPSASSEEMIGLIRLKWWQEEITKLYNTSAHTHPTLQLSAPLVATSPLSPADYQPLIDALVEQISDPHNPEHISKALQVYYALLAKTAGGGKHEEHYRTIGDVQAHIAMIRATAKQEKEAQLQELLKKELTQLQLPNEASAYLRALYALNQCWIARIHAFRTDGRPSITQPISMLALRLAYGVILRHK